MSKSRKRQKLNKVDQAFLLHDLPGYIFWLRHLAKTQLGLGKTLLAQRDLWRKNQVELDARWASLIERTELREEQAKMLLAYADALEAGRERPPWDEPHDSTT
jgi:hypothetical protein